jgi:hypothetical protein
MARRVFDPSNKDWIQYTAFADSDGSRLVTATKERRCLKCIAVESRTYLRKVVSFSQFGEYDAQNAVSSYGFFCCKKPCNYMLISSITLQMVNSTTQSTDFAMVFSTLKLTYRFMVQS